MCLPSAFGLGAHVLPAWGREAADPTRPRLGARGAGRGGRPSAAPLPPRPPLGARLLAVGLPWPLCEKEQGRRACASGALRPAPGPAEAIGSPWQPALASCCPWRPVRLLQGRSRPSRLACRGGKKTSMRLPGVSSAMAAGRRVAVSALCWESPLSRVLGQSSLRSWWKIACGSAGGEGGGGHGRRAGRGPAPASCWPESERRSERLGQRITNFSQKKHNLISAEYSFTQRPILSPHINRAAVWRTEEGPFPSRALRVKGSELYLKVPLRGERRAQHRSRHAGFTRQTFHSRAAGARWIRTIQDGGDGTCHHARLGRAHGKEWCVTMPTTGREEKRKCRDLTEEGPEPGSLPP